jgi:uncharacterized protein (TIGR03086 family)
VTQVFVRSVQVRKEGICDDQTMSTAERYRRLSQRFTDIVASVPSDRFGSPSPCEGWSVSDIIGHVVTTELDILERMSFGPDSKPDVVDPLTAWPIVRARMQTVLENHDQAAFAYDGYFGPTTFSETIDTFYCADLTVHGWDIARAAGLTDWEPVEQSEIDTVMAAFGPDSALAPALRQPGLFGEPTTVADNADATTRLMAWLGRHT